MQTRRLGADGPEVSAVALGGMLLSITGRPPEDQGIAVIHAALDAGVTLIDTADAYCTDERDFNHNEKLIAKALRYRRPRPLVATKVGCRRPGGAWTVDARPETLISATHRCLDALGIDCIDHLQLHAPDIRVPFSESVGALARLREQGKVRYIGLCNVNVSQIEEGRRVTAIASIQNRWNVNDRRPETEGVLDYCVQNGLAFMAYSPFGGTLGAPSLGTHGRIAEEARRRRVSPYRLVLAWMLAKCPVAITIAGARRLESIMDSAAAGNMQLLPADVKAIETALKATPPQPISREPTIRSSAPPVRPSEEPGSAADEEATAAAAMDEGDVEKDSLVPEADEDGDGEGEEAPDPDAEEPGEDLD